MPGVEHDRACAPQTNASIVAHVHRGDDVTTDRSGFWIAMRLVVLAGAAYFAFATWTLVGK